MSDAYVIEVANETAGIVVRQENEKTYRFHASLPRYYPLDGKLFSAPRDAERAAIAQFGSRFKQKARAA
ncbi:hypothetical protein [Hyphomicrobium sp.]|uniref:hypothetical protein n=1 Tax=Hyphomicrobium sp. TaxID=82 RepID=UPI002C9971D0|nr:hypothetical protein [Hyphomicrobium sp.]HRN87815.1 hypothetical protein [Hyphomicrobium sp.]HRQ26936.1 hypothetical protein [Hyphomicrobium sp.]